VNLADLKFQATDGVENPNGVRVISIERANALLEERISRAAQVFGRHDAGGGCNVWDGRRMPWDLYQARLVCVEAVPPKERS
jgi:hypothetical protein